jgi:hypothetical protein
MFLANEFHVDHREQNPSPCRAADSETSSLIVSGGQLFGEHYPSKWSTFTLAITGSLEPQFYAELLSSAM